MVWIFVTFNIGSGSWLTTFSAFIFPRIALASDSIRGISGSISDWIVRNCNNDAPNPTMTSSNAGLFFASVGSSHISIGPVANSRSLAIFASVSEINLVSSLFCLPICSVFSVIFALKIRNNSANLVDISDLLAPGEDGVDLIPSIPFNTCKYSLNALARSAAILSASAAAANAVSPSLWHFSIAANDFVTNMSISAPIRTVCPVNSLFNAVIALPWISATFSINLVLDFGSE